MGDGGQERLVEWASDEWRSVVLPGARDFGGAGRLCELAREWPAKSIVRREYAITRPVATFFSLRFLCGMGDDYACSALWVTSGKLHCSYACALWRMSRGGQVPDEPEFVAVSSVPVSMDGEYRSPLVPWAKVFATVADAGLSRVEEELRALGARGAISTSATHCPGSASPSPAAAEHVQFLVLAVSVVLDAVLDSMGYLETTNVDRDWVSFVRSPLLRGARDAAVAGCRDVFERIVGGRAETQAGLKLVPLFSGEAAAIRDARHPAWRELIVAQAASDLVINGAAPGLPLYNLWTLVDGVVPELFSGAAMRVRFADNGRVRPAEELVREARRRLRPLAENGRRAAELESRLRACLEYARAQLETSQVALAHTMEHVGTTLANFAVRGGSPKPADTKPIRLACTAGLAAKLLFDYAWAAHCLHTKLGVTHGDVHGNNLTTYVWHTPTSAEVAGELAGGLAAYALSPGEEDTFVFPASGSSGCLIDFSRALAGPAARAWLAEASTGHPTAFYRDQAGRVMRALRRAVGPRAEAESEQLRAIVVARLDAVFPLLCAADFAMIGRSFAEVLGPAAERRPAAEPGNSRAHHGAEPGDPAAAWSVSSAAALLGHRLERAASTWLQAGYAALFDGGSSGEVSTECPGAAILRDVFGGWLWPRWPEGARGGDLWLAELYRADLPLAYSGTRYDSFPPWGRVDQLQKRIPPALLEASLGPEGFAPFRASLRRGAAAAALAERERLSARQADGDLPASTAASWAD